MAEIKGVKPLGFKCQVLGEASNIDYESNRLRNAVGCPFCLERLQPFKPYGGRISPHMPDQTPRATLFGGLN
jgi:hypothetical protein